MYWIRFGQYLDHSLLWPIISNGPQLIIFQNKIISLTNSLAGTYDLHRQCLKYPEACVSGAPLQYAVTLVQSQEANFIIGTAINFIYVIILSSYMSAVTSNLSTARHDTMSHEEDEECGEDKVLYSQVAN